MKPLIQQVLGTPGGITADNAVDAEGMPAGGTVNGTGLSIEWQQGPLGRGGQRMHPNGAFVEDVLMAVLQRVRHYQEVADGRFRCRQNSLAITHIEEALHWLADRTAERELAGVEGTHGVIES